jgi:hypothetical protein
MLGEAHEHGGCSAPSGLHLSRKARARARLLAEASPLSSRDASARIAQRVVTSAGFTSSILIRSRLLVYRRHKQAARHGGLCTPSSSDAAYQSGLTQRLRNSTRPS